MLILIYVTLSCAMLCHILCCVVLCCGCCAVLCCVVFCDVKLCYAVFFSVMLIVMCSSKKYPCPQKRKVDENSKGEGGFKSPIF